MTIDAEFIERQKVIRREILKRLYAKTATNPKPPARDFIYERDFLNMGYNPKEVEFALRYLAEAGEIKPDGAQIRIGLEGIRAIEAQPFMYEGD